MSAAWTLLIVAGLLEVVWAVGLKHTEGFTRLLPSAITLTAMLLSIVLLARALRTIPVGPAMRSGPESVRWAPRWLASCCSASRRVPAD